MLRKLSADEVLDIIRAADLSQSVVDAFQDHCIDGLALVVLIQKSDFLNFLRSKELGLGLNLGDSIKLSLLLDSLKVFNPSSNSISTEAKNTEDVGFCPQ
ncbi:hypothetical protein HK096_004654, partial [Nowakowskiella sp. JEL0078]